MKLHEVSNIGTWENIFKQIDYKDPDAAANLGSTLWFKWQYRSVRSIYEKGLTMYLMTWLSTNKQKLHYILDSANEDILQTQNISDTTNQAEDKDFNIDYFGGEGERTKGTNMNNSKYISTNVDMKNKLWNFNSSTENRIFYQLADEIFETFEFSEDLTW